MNSRIRNILWCMSPFFIAFILQFVAGFMSSGMWLAVAIHNYTGSTMADLSSAFRSEESLATYMDITSFFYSSISAVVFFVMYFAVFYNKKGKYYNKAPYVTPGREPRFSLKNFSLVKVLIGSVLLVGGITILVNFLLIAVSTAFPDWLEEFIELEKMAGLSGDVSFLTVFYAVILGPVSEELMFRGCTFEYARRGTGAAGAIVIQALLFAAMHMNKLQSTYTFVIGLALGYVYYITGNILFTILLHILYNGLQFIQPDMSGAVNTPVAVFLTILCGFVITYASLLMFKNSVLPEKEEGII